MQKISKAICTNGTLVTIINNSTNTSSLARGIFAHCTQDLINQAKKEGLKVFTNNKGEAFISIPNHIL